MTGKFTTLELNRKWMFRVSLLSDRLTEPTNEFLASIKTYYFSAAIVTIFVSCAIYYAHDASSEYEDIMNFCYVTVGCLQWLGMYFSVGLNMKKMKRLVLKLQETVDEDNGIEVSDIYWNAESQCRKYTKNIIYFVLIRQVLYITLYCTSSIVYILIGKTDTSAWSFPMEMAFPFPLEPIWGYYLALFIEMNCIFAYDLVFVLLPSFFCCCCLYIVAICHHFVFLTQSIHDDNELILKAKRSGEAVKIQQRFIKKFIKSIKMHLRAVEVFDLASDINTGAIFFFLPTNCIYIAFGAFNIEHSDLVLSTMFSHFAHLTAPLMWCSIYCYFANSATDNMGSVGNVAFESNWYYYPLNQQKWLIPIINRSQTPSKFNGFGMVYCTLEVFGNLLKSSCSYYLLFRELANR